MKTVISAAGNLKRENPSMDEVSSIQRGAQGLQGALVAGVWGDGPSRGAPEQLEGRGSSDLGLCCRS